MESCGRSRLDKNLIIKILETIGHEEVLLPRKRKNKILPKIPKDKSYLTKRVVNKQSVTFDETKKDKFHTYSSRLDAYKPERLYVDDDAHLPGKAITTNIDPEFYTIVAGRAITDVEKLADHQWAIRNCFLTRLTSDKLDKKIASIQLEKLRQDDEFEYAYNALCVQSDSFNQFLKQDYSKSAELLQKAEKATKETLELESKMLDLKKELELIESKVIRLDEKWRCYQMLKKFLISISPIQWTNDDNNQSLYFNEPEKLEKVFIELEDKNLAYLVQCENLQPAVITMEKAWKNETSIYEKNSTALTEDVEEMRKTVNDGVKKLNDVKNQVDILCKTHVHGLVSDKRTINLTACLEDAYERVVGPNDSCQSPLEMMRAIETAHEKLRLELDLLPADLVKRITIAWFREEKRLMDEAKIASKKVHQMDMLVKRFRNAVKIWTPNPKRRLIERSKPPRNVLKLQNSHRELTIEELEQKYFFQVETKEDNPDLLYRPMC